MWGWLADSRRTMRRMASATARGGAAGMVRRFRDSPTALGLSRSTLTLRQPSVDAPWVALAGSSAGAKPENASEASRRRPSISALY